MESSKAAIPLIKDNYIYLLSRFEQFWSLYPEKKSKILAWQTFQILNPGEMLFSKIMNALNLQIQNRQEKMVQGIWVPPWKYPGNWLAQCAWEDEITTKQLQENHHAIHQQNTRNQSPRDMFWIPDDEIKRPSNVIDFKKR